MKKLILIFILIVFLISSCEKKEVGTKIVNPDNYLDCSFCIKNGFYWCDALENSKCIDTGRVITRYECEGDLKGAVVSDVSKC